MCVWTQPKNLVKVKLTSGPCFLLITAGCITAVCKHRTPAQLCAGRITCTAVCSHGTPAQHGTTAQLCASIEHLHSCLQEESPAQLCAAMERLHSCTAWNTCTAVLRRGLLHSKSCRLWHRHCLSVDHVVSEIFRNKDLSDRV